jgi:ABC-type nitrate/sulfonate/bicarbonate transport system substrate-binding protein
MLPTLAPRPHALLAPLLVLSLLACGPGAASPAARAPVPPAGEPSDAPRAPAPTAPAAPARLVTVRMALPTTDLNYILPLSVAEAQGFFREEGVEVQTQQITSNAAIPAQLNGEVDLASGGTAITAAAQGAPLRAVFFPYNSSTFHLSVDPNRVREPRDLMGQTLGIASVSNTQDIATKLMVRALGIDPLAVNYLPLGGEHNRVAAMLSGQIVGSANNPNVAIELKRHGFTIIANSAAVMPIPFSGYGAHTTYIREQGATLRAWMRAMIRALQYIRQQPEAAGETAARALDMDPAIARESVPLLLEVMYPEDPGGFTEAGLLEQIRIIRETVPDTRAVTIDDVTDVTPLREAQRSLGIQCVGGYRC